MKWVLILMTTCLIAWWFKQEIQAIIKGVFKIPICIFEALGALLKDLKRRLTLLQPFGRPLARNLIEMVWYGILAAITVLAVIGNYGLLRSRLEAFFPFRLSDEGFLSGISGIIAALITAAEIVMSWLVLEAWTNPDFLRFDIDTVKPQRPLSYTRAAFVLFCITYAIVLFVDCAVTYQGNLIQTGSVFSSILMAMLTIVLSITFAFLNFYSLHPFMIVVVAFLRNILSGIIEVFAFVVYLIHALFTNAMLLLLGFVDLLAKVGAGLMMPFKRKYRPESLPAPAKVAVAFLLAGMLTLAWSQPLRISKRCIVALLDLTGSFEHSSESVDHIGGILEALQPGDEIYVLSITSSSFHDRENLLFKAQVGLPEYSNQLYSEEYRASVELLRTELCGKWQKVAKGLSRDARKTDVWGSLAYASIILHNSRSRNRYLLIYSDLEHNVSETCDARLTDVIVYCLFIEHKGFKEYKKKTDAWQGYFKKSGVKDLFMRIPAQSDIKLR